MADLQKENLTVVSETMMRKNSSGDFVSGKMDREVAYSAEKKGSSFGKLFVVGLLAVALAGGLIATIVIYESQPPRREFGWWHSTTIYQIYPWSFKDSNGDGIGDLKGITSKLDHLKELGVETIWLSPVYPSPMKDFGYDISNYRDIYPPFGTLADFEEMLDKMHEKGLKLFMDFVPNHSSDEHVWFKESVRKAPGFSEYYIWHKGHPTRNITVENSTEVLRPAPPNNWRSVFGGDAWEWHPERREYYYHAFLTSQPDLNWRNPALVKEMDEVLEFWLKKGVDGFRIDAVPFLFEQEHDIIDANETTLNPYAESDLLPSSYNYIVHPLTLNLPETYLQVQNWTKLMKKYTDGEKNGVPKFLIIEVVTKNTTIINGYYPEDPFVTPTMPFYFGLIWMDNRTTGFDIERLVNDCLDKLPKGGWPTWNIGNHDQLRATDRLGNRGLIDGLNMVNLLLPGTPTSYYGEEIGMLNTELKESQIVDPAALNLNGTDPNWVLRSRDPARAPMQWDSSTSAGFSTNSTTWLPVGPEWNTTRNVAYQKNATRSHYKVYRKLIQIRKGPAFKTGTMRPGLIDDSLYSFVRENLDQRYLVAIDLRRSGTETVEYDFSDVVQGTGELVVASVNLYNPDGTLRDAALDRPIKMDKVPLTPSGAIVLKLK
ncbi:hypothetical protein RvY_07967 [Ramazzottius varieornatus]|uniref:alpha-glucosidase n=1 Tax=Ramazzottius varieornatus TaxID=947166 RepID=A0A1D1V9Z7_RAMVA|nr:hypothetical protein RvY_07967 [Ramazzottius varieornatus]